MRALLPGPGLLGRSLLGAALLAGCPPGDKPPSDTASVASACDPGPRAQLALDSDQVDFGYVPSGSTATAVATLSNEGDAPLGLDAIRVGESDEYGVEVDASGCASESGDVAVLEPGCDLPLRLTYTPRTSGGMQAALIVEDTTEGADFGVDPLHAWDVVWLTGTTDGERVPDDPYIVGAVIRMGQTAIRAGETTEMEVRVGGAEAITYTWSTDAADAFGFVDEPVVYYTAPTVSAGGRYENVYAVVRDAEARQDWAFAHVSVYPAEKALYPCE
jgi:hypothetical protein